MNSDASLSNEYNTMIIKEELLLKRLKDDMSILNIAYKGIIKVISIPWELLLGVILPKSTEGFYLFVHIFIPLFLIWNISEIELLILENLTSKLNISASFIGLTIMSWGNNAPDLFSVASAMSKGMTDLALNAAIASEIHNILLGLGLPWLIYNCTFNQSIPFTGGDVYTITVLFFCFFIIAFLVGLYLNDKKLNTRFAIFLFMTYVIFLIIIFIFLFKTQE
jgi:Ca2+/Na+ antiporter